jgi:curli biogenesis system outer membrane secretion channel CsgG
MIRRSFVETVLKSLAIVFFSTVFAVSAVTAKDKKKGDDEEEAPSNYESVNWAGYSGPKTGIAVLSFEDGINPAHIYEPYAVTNSEAGYSWPVGEGLANRMVTTLIETNRFDVVEREIAEAIFNLYKADVAKKIYVNGKQSRLPQVPGVRFFVTGSLTEILQSTEEKGIGITVGKLSASKEEETASFTLHMRVIDSQTGSVAYSKAITGLAKVKKKSLALTGSNAGFGLSKADNAKEQAIQKLLDQAIGDLIALAQ